MHGLVALAAGAAGGVLAAGALAAARARRIRCLEAEGALEGLVALAGALAPADWLSSLERALRTLVARGHVAAVSLYAITEAGHLEPRAVVGQGAEIGDTDLARLPARGGDPVPLAAGLMAVPLRHDGDLVGCLAVRLHRPAHGPALRTLLAGVGHLAALALAALREQQRHLALSVQDGLTGLPNHRHFHHLLAASLAQAYLHDEPCSLILFDIDNFKKVNDTCGHLFGDLVLREVAQAARRVLPRSAVLARYGGEEFAVVLPGMGVAEAAALAEEIRQAVAGHPILDFATGEWVRVTVSLGVAGYELGQGKERLIARADEALYASKRGGRNRVTLAAAPLPTTVPDAAP